MAGQDWLYGLLQPFQPFEEKTHYTLPEIDGSIGRESVTWDSRIDHPDRWMVPIRPKKKFTACSLGVDLPLETRNWLLLSTAV